MINRQRSLLLCTLLGALVALGGCRQDMHDQPKYSPLEKSAFFNDGRASRQPVEGTVARGQLRLDDHLYTGRLPQPAGTEGAADYVTTFPFEIDEAAMDRGEQRYNVFCSPCHDQVGYGNGMVVRRGFRRASSFHDERLQEAPVGYFYDVISNGFGAMSSYASQIPVEDRWKIIAYVRALQLSQDATLQDVPAAERKQMADAAQLGG
jgi:mono/diheme cytochrome c family protein